MSSCTGRSRWPPPPPRCWPARRWPRCSWAGGPSRRRWRISSEQAPPGGGAGRNGGEVAVFGPGWATSPRRFRVIAERDVRIPLPDGNALVGDVFRPDTGEPVPVIAGFHPYNNEFQTGPMMPAGFSLQRGWLESGDPYFFARRGYAHGVFNVRGTGKSTGTFQAMGPTEARDTADAIEWLASRPWCTGKVGLFGISSWRFLSHWKDKFDGLRYESWYRERHGDDAYRRAIAAALDDDEIAAIPPIVACLRDPVGANALVTDVVLARTDNEWFAERRVD